MMSTPHHLAVVYGTAIGVGGLGLQVGNAIAELAGQARKVVAIGPGLAPAALPARTVERVDWRTSPVVLPDSASRHTWLRWLIGRRQYLHDTRLGKWAAGQVAEARPELCYCFTQVALETLRWANAAGVRCVVESPNGHLRNFREVYVRETRRWGGHRYLGHPTEPMVRRVEEEYARADVIRVSSDWAKQTFIDQGLAADRVVVVPQSPVALEVAATGARATGDGPLRVCFVGSLDLRKGFVYLLRAVRRVGASRLSLTLVGGTVDRHTRRLLAREVAGLDVRVAPGDPSPAYRDAELFVLPTLEDGSPFVVFEAMAAGLPLVVTDQCGNYPLIRPGESGWVVPAGDDGALAAALADAVAHRADLAVMGARARADWEALSASSTATDLGEVLARTVGSPPATLPCSSCGP
jgi:glycosyltransferase involved in cell wall biosynthesis